jgi:predicted CoA-binding protein
MTSKADVDDFIAQKSLAIAGVSRGGKKFGNTILKELTGQGYRLFPVHPEAADVEGVPAYRSCAALPEPVGGVIVVVPPDKAAGVIRDAAAAGITRVWLQQGAASAEAIAAATQRGMRVVHGECIVMFAGSHAWYHRAHRWVNGEIGRLPR